MKVLFLNWRDIKNPNAGGAEVVIHQIAMRLVKKGFDVQLLTSRFHGCLHKEEIDGIEIIRIGNSFSLYPKACLKYLTNYREDIDVVVDAINTIPFFTPLYVKKPIVALIFQLTKDVYFKQFPKSISYPAYTFEPLLFRIYKNHNVIVLSNSIKEELANLGFNKVSVVEPGIDHEKLAPGEKTQYPSILYLNRIVPYKCADHLVIAFKKVKKEVPEAKLIIVGFRGKSKYENYVKELVKKLNLTNDVIFHGFISGEKKVKLLQSAWVHVLPSIREGWGISITEAGACGTPSIGYNVVGVKDAIKDGYSGIIVEKENIDALANTIITILKDGNLREKLSRNAVEWAKQFSWEKSADKFEGVIKNAIKQKF
jgi:glycosyltransferase involved in cell wall biosynthesis